MTYEKMVKWITEKETEKAGIFLDIEISYQHDTPFGGIANVILGTT